MNMDKWKLFYWKDMEKVQMDITTNLNTEKTQFYFYEYQRFIINFKSFL